MTIRRTTRLLVVALVLALGVIAGPARSAPAQAALAPYPSSMTALGDSITRGFNAAGWFVDWPSRSWSTGTYSAVNSHYLRIRTVNSAITGRNYNDARTGAEMDELDTQAAAAASRGVQYVTVLIGANDACKSTEAAMTPVSTFQSEYAAALAILASRVPNARILVVSIPDLYRLWSVGKGSSAARTAWAVYGICQSMLANPLSTAQADVDRRARVRQRVVDYNAVLRDGCAVYVTTCRFDGNAVFSYPFVLSQLSTWDYFHPNTAGQAVLADVSNRAGYQW